MAKSTTRATWVGNVEKRPNVDPRVAPTEVVELVEALVVAERRAEADGVVERLGGLGRGHRRRPAPARHGRRPCPRGRAGCRTSAASTRPPPGGAGRRGRRGRAPWRGRGDAGAACRSARGTTATSPRSPRCGRGRGRTPRRPPRRPRARAGRPRSAARRPPPVAGEHRGEPVTSRERLEGRATVARRHRRQRPRAVREQLVVPTIAAGAATRPSSPQPGPASTGRGPRPSRRSTRRTRRGSRRGPRARA